MMVRTDTSELRSSNFLKNAAVRTGIYSGAFLSLIFTAWILIANHAPFFERVATERNIAATALLVFFFCTPLVRFYRSPGDLLLSGLIAWGLLTLTYRILCFFYLFLEEHDSPFHVFVLGAVSYFVFATLSWIGTIIWRVRAADSSHIHH